MKNEILIELCKIWQAETTVTAAAVDGKASLDDARLRGMREAKRQCADTIIMLVNTFKD